MMDVTIAPEHRERIEQFRARHRTGVLTLLFTDVVGSTEIKQRLGDAAGVELIRRHQEIVREVLAAFSEAEEISTAGDSFFIVFVKPSDGVRFALRLQNTLRSWHGHPAHDSGSTGILPEIQLRIGTHMGEVFIEEKAEGALERDVLGIQVDTASRVMSLAGGGQVLLTRSVFDNARTILKGEALAGLATLSWLNHGLYSVKGVEEPIEVCEVGEEGLAPLAAPTDSDKARRYVAPDQEPVLGWRPAVEQTVPGTEWALGEKLGEGGFGEVWLARHRRTKELRVFKFCFRADRLRNLKREMTLFRILKEVLGERPDIARLYNVQFEEAPYYLELEYTPGGNLADWLARKAEEQTAKTPSTPSEPEQRSVLGELGALAVPLSLRLEIVAQIATALAAAHSVGVIHKDVKPSNILIEEKKEGSVQVRLTDFGIGQLLDRAALERAGITATGFTETAGAMSELSSRTGTRLYMAPELLAGRPPSIQSDIYSLGVLLYQLIIGDLSQPMTTDWERHVRDPLLRDDLRHCLAGNPSERFHSANDLARNVRALPHRQKRRQLNRLAQAGVFAVIALALAAGVILGLQRYQLRREMLLRQRAQEERDHAQREQYYAQIALAEKCIEEQRFDHAGEILAACPKQLRSWEWGRLQYLRNSQLLTLKGHGHSIYSVAFSPDGGRIVTAGGDGTARIWDTQTGKIVLTVGASWVSRALEKLLRDVNASKVGVPTDLTEFMSSAAFSPDGKCIATGSEDNSASIWDARTGRELLTLKGHADSVYSVAWSPDGKRLATGSMDRTAKVWDVRTGRDLLTLRGHTDFVPSVVFSLDGRKLATGSGGKDNTVRIWNVQTGEELQSLKVQGDGVLSVAFSPDGKHLATAQLWGGAASVCDLETGREILALKGHSNVISSVAFSMDGKRLATGSWDDTAKVWDAQTGRELLWLKRHANDVYCVAFSPDAKYLVTGSKDGTAKVWDVEVGREMETSRKERTPEVCCITFSPDGNRLAAANDEKTVKLWDVNTGRELRTLSGHTKGTGTITFSPDGKYLATGGYDNTARLWDAETGHEIRTFTGHLDAVRSVAFSRDAKRLATGSHDGTAKIWDAETARELLTFKGDTTAPVASVVFSPEGSRLATGSWDKTIRVWDVEKGRELLTIRLQREREEEFVWSVAFSPDGKRLAAGIWDHTARIFDAKSGRELVVLKGHTIAVFSVAFSPDGKRLATGSQDHTAKVWDVETGREILSLNAGIHTFVYSVAFSPDGLGLATTAEQGAVTIWKALPWRDEDLPGDGSMSYDERIQLYKLEQWKKRQEQEKGKSEK